MDKTQNTGANIVDDIFHPKPDQLECAPTCTTRFMHPEEVVADLQLTCAEKREILASWASDVHAVSNTPTLRQLDNGAVVRIADILQALRCLDDDQDLDQTASRRFLRVAGLGAGISIQLNSVLRRTWSDDDDDDPPPCPAVIVRPFGGPLSGGEMADPGLAVAA